MTRSECEGTTGAGLVQPEAGNATSELNDRMVAFGLRRLRRPTLAGYSVDPFLGWVRTLTALEAYQGVDFVLDWTAWPSTAHGQGTLDVTLFAYDRYGGADRTRLEGDLKDLLHAQAELYQFEHLDSKTARTLLEPFRPCEVAEVRRRRERLPGRSGPLGFESDVGRGESLEAVSLWPSDDHDRRTRESLATALLSQDDPVSLRFLLRPTHMTNEELANVSELADELDRIPSPVAAGAAAATRTLLRAHPVFEVQVLVASAGRLSPACLSSVGFAISPPAAPHLRSDRLEGGYETNRELDGPGPLTTAFTSLHVHASTEEFETGRSDRLMDVWQTAAAARPPVPSQGTFPGLDVGMPSLSLPGACPDREGVLLGQDIGGRDVVLPHEDRMRHTYMLGQTGTGKTTLMLSMIADDLAADRGIAVVDPHGDLIEAALALVPEHRWDEVVLIEPTDPHAVVGLNLLQADTDLQREFLVAEMCAWMYALYDPRHQGIVGPRFESMLRYSAQLLMQDQEDWSLMEIPRLFTDLVFTKRLVDRATDPLVREFWVNDARSRRSNDYAEVAAWFRSKFEPFRSVTPLRRVLGQTSSTVNLAEVMDRGGIVFANLSKGLLGEYNARLLGFVVFARLWAATMARAEVPVDQRREFHIYLDEAQTITTSSLPTILSEARKFGVSATLANQFFGQIPDELREAVLGNVGTKLAFRMGATDAAAFAGQYGHEVDVQQLRRLPNFEFLGDVLIDGEPQEVQHVRTAPVPASSNADEWRAALRQRARRNWALPVDWIDRDFTSRYQDPSPTNSGPRSEPEVQPGFLDDWLKERREAVRGQQRDAS